MNWDDVRVFLAVARTGQILGAARRLGLNHTTVGRRLSALEAELDTRLFERRPSGCAITAAGAGFLPHAERMETELGAARDAVAGDDAAMETTIRIGAPDGFGTAFLAPRLWRIRLRHPGLTIQLVPVPRAFSLARREVDIAVTVERPDTGRLVAAKLTDYRLGLYASPAYLDEAGRPEAPAALARHRLVGAVSELLYSPRLDYAADITGEWPAGYEVSSALGQVEAVAAGAGIGILHGFMAERRADLERILPTVAVDRAYWLVVHESAHDARPIATVAGAIREMVAADRALFTAC